MVNAIPMTKQQIRREVVLYAKVQRFWNRTFEKPDAVAVINGLTFTRFTAARHLNINDNAVRRYREWLGKEGLSEGII